VEVAKALVEYADNIETLERVTGALWALCAVRNSLTLSFESDSIALIVTAMNRFRDSVDLHRHVIGLMGLYFSDHQRYAIQLRKELMVNTSHMLSTKYRRGFYRHVDAILDERLLIGSNNARLAGRGVGDAAAAVAMLGGGLDLGGDGKDFIGRGGDCKINNILDGTTGGGKGAIGYDTASATAEAETSFSSLQPMGYFILAEFITQIRTKLSPAQSSRTIRIFSRLLHSDLTTGFCYVLRIITQSWLPNLTFPRVNTNPDPVVGCAAPP
jgi:hypothetical protein